MTRPPPTTMRYPAAYTWLVFLAAMDVMLTSVVLHAGGKEVNAVAAWIIARFGLPGMVGFKFALVVVIVLVCEAVGRRREPTARRLAEWAVAVTAIPVVIGLVMLAVKRLGAGAV